MLLHIHCLVESVLRILFPSFTFYFKLYKRDQNTNASYLENICRVPGEMVVIDEAYIIIDKAYNSHSYPTIDYGKIVMLEGLFVYLYVGVRLFHSRG